MSWSKDSLRELFVCEQGKDKNFKSLSVLSVAVWIFFGLETVIVKTFCLGQL